MHLRLNTTVVDTVDKLEADAVEEASVFEVNPSPKEYEETWDEGPV